jgi:hypothetical protein
MAFVENQTTQPRFGMKMYEVIVKFNIGCILISGDKQLRPIERSVIVAPCCNWILKSVSRAPRNPERGTFIWDFPEIQKSQKSDTYGTNPSYIWDVWESFSVQFSTFKSFGITRKGRWLLCLLVGNWFDADGVWRMNGIPIELSPLILLILSWKVE